MLTLSSMSDLERALASDCEPTLLLLGAEWCPNCRRQDQILREGEDELRRLRVAIYRADTEESPEIAHRYDVIAIPSLLKLERGAAVDRLVGVVSLQEVLRLALGG